MPRSRSVSRSRVTRVSQTEDGITVLDPVALLKDILDNIKTLNIPLMVNVTDGTLTASYLLSTFIMHEYRVIDNKVHFGIKKLDIDHLHVSISFDINVESDQILPLT
jgi:hypothetical protein